MNKPRGLSLAMSLLALLPLFGSIQMVTADDECEDIKYEDDPLEMPGTSHGDNNPSEGEFKDLLFEESATLCEVAFCYDDNSCKGELEHHERKEFKQTIAYEGASEDQQDCLDHRYSLPDGGKPALQAYELFDCAVGNY